MIVAEDSGSLFIFTPVIALLASLGVLMLIVVLVPVLERVATWKVLRVIFGAPSSRNKGGGHVATDRETAEPCYAPGGVPPGASSRRPAADTCLVCGGSGVLASQPRGQCWRCKGIGWLP